MKFLKVAQGKKLFAQVVQKPKEGAPREVLSDWLTERGDPLGEFIALQLKKPGTRRETQLRMAHEADWLGPIHAIADGMSIQFEGGFLSALKIDAFRPDAKFMADLRAATGHPAFSLVRELTLKGHVAHGGLWNEAGSIMNPPRAKGAKIPIVALLTHAVFGRLELVRADRFELEDGPAMVALRKLRPKLEFVPL